MNPPRRLLPLGLGVVVLLGLAGIASHGRPLAGGRGSGPTATFFDYFATTLVLAWLAMLAVVLYFVFSERWERNPRGQLGRRHLLSSLLALAGGAAIAFLILHSHFEQRLKELEQRVRPQGQAAQTRRPPSAKDVRNPRIRWDEIAVVAVLAGGAAVLLLAGRRAKGPPRALPRRRSAAVSLALDESIDDLRADPDLRRAIVAAYARMEHALAHAGLPRRPAEAPFEYVERALTSLDTSAGSARRLTALFEWAKFSQHEPGPEMRDDAVDALVAVRDELRGAVAV